MIDLVAELDNHLPLRIDSAQFSMDCLSLRGSEWSLTIHCPWRFTSGTSLWFSWSDDNAVDLVKQLENHNIVRTRMIDNGTDPAFLTSLGPELQLFADTDWDPWVLRVPDTIYVGITSSPGVQ